EAEESKQRQRRRRLRQSVGVAGVLAGSIGILISTYSIRLSACCRLIGRVAAGRSAGRALGTLIGRRRWSSGSGGSARLAGSAGRRRAALCILISRAGREAVRD